MEKTIREVEALLPEPTKKASEVSCMFGGVSPMMKSVLLCQLIEISTKYIELLDNSLWPVIVKVFGNRPFIFQDDNAILIRLESSYSNLEWNGLSQTFIRSLYAPIPARKRRHDPKRICNKIPAVPVSK